MLFAPLLLSCSLTMASGPAGPLAQTPDATPSGISTPAQVPVVVAEVPVVADPTDNKPPTPPHTGIRALFTGLKGDVRHLPSRSNLYLALVGGAAAGALYSADSGFNARLNSHDVLVNNLFKPASYYGNTPEQMALSIGTYAVGRIFDLPKVSHLGMDLLRAQAVTEMLVTPIKLATRRLRPDGSDHLSFPSGHAAITFAAATVIQRHLGWRNSVLAYAIASYVAASRLHDNRHYLSDVVFGAAVGTIAGRTVTEHGRDAWTFAPAPTPGGIAIVATRTR